MIVMYVIGVILLELIELMVNPFSNNGMVFEVNVLTKNRINIEDVNIVNGNSVKIIEDNCKKEKEYIS